MERGWSRMAPSSACGRVDLEREADSDLHDPWIARQAGNGAERGRVADVAIRQAVVDGVEQIEDVPPQRRRRLLVEADLTLDGEIEILEPGPGEAIAQLVAEHARGDRREGGDVEPLIDRLRAIGVAVDVGEA